MLEDWMNGNKLVVNPDKTHLLVMGTKQMAGSRTNVSMQEPGQAQLQKQSISGVQHGSSQRQNMEPCYSKKEAKKVGVSECAN